MDALQTELDTLDALIGQAPTGSLYLRRGLVRWKLQRHGAAIADYERAVALDGPGSEAAAVLDMARRVMDFYNKDMYNP